MRLRDSVARVSAEGVLRAIVIALLAGALVEAIRVARHGAAERSDTAHLRPALARWSTVAAPVRDTLGLRRLLVLGQAQWETKFTIAALEERGWQVDAHIVVSPKGKGDVRQGDIGVIDTARYSAVLAVDTTAARYGARIG